MSIRVFLLLILLCGAAHASTGGDAGKAPTATDLGQAIEQARTQADIPFTLEVHCTDKQARRALRIYPDGVATWNHELQLRPSRALRAELLGLLLQYDFPSFAESYGETGESDLMDGALRVSCRVFLAIDGLRKSSVQFYDGPQEAKLLGLAGALLDRLQPLTAAGTRVRSLADGIAKLASGKLDPQLMTLRYVVLPRRGGQPGSIVRVGDGRLSRQGYAPGREIGDISEAPMPACRIHQLLSILEAADIPGLPLNLWFEDRIQLEVAVLNHRKTIVARPFARLKASRSSPAQQRFAALLGKLDALASAAIPDCDTEN